VNRLRAGVGGVVIALALAPGGSLWAQAGPPFLTNDPGTPGDGHWEINLGAMQLSEHQSSNTQLPQIDANLGIGERLQLTYEVPYVFASATGEPQHGGWGNSVLGLKWRFFDQGDKGWQLATFPQLTLARSASAVQNGLATEGPRLFVPLEVSRQVGPLVVDFEAGYFFARNGPEERILGLVVGGTVTTQLELDAELYSDRVMGAPPGDTTLDLGVRYHLHPAFILLAMAGRSINGNSDGHSQFFGYLGVQVLLSDYGRYFTHESGQ
jgi:hypothetical protein